MVKAFEKYTGIKIPFKFSPRRPGDVDYIYASTDLANEKLNWKSKYTLKDMIKTSWLWAKNLNSVFYEVTQN
jgi:UDP-glucose 4-epimerase